MSMEFQNYKAAVSDVSKTDPHAEWQHIVDWFHSEGREQFTDAFFRETGLLLGTQPSVDDLAGAALPKSFRDLERKAQDDAFYRAHAIWFLEEMDSIIHRVPQRGANPLQEYNFGGVIRFTRSVLLDSVLLFEHWGSYRAGVPGVYGINKNIAEHMMAFYQGARQTIYGHGSPGLSFADNHSDLAIATIRQAIEIRLRRAFGIMGKIQRTDGSIHPVPLGHLFEAIDAHKQKVVFPIRFENIKRIDSWANMYLHAALKMYAWCPPRVLNYLRVFLLGGEAPGWTSNSKAGVALDRATFDAIRGVIRERNDARKFELSLADASQCEALIR